MYSSIFVEFEHCKMWTSRIEWGASKIVGAAKIGFVSRICDLYDFLRTLQIVIAILILCFWCMRIHQVGNTTCLNHISKNDCRSCHIAEVFTWGGHVDWVELKVYQLLSPCWTDLRLHTMWALRREIPWQFSHFRSQEEFFEMAKCLTKRTHNMLAELIRWLYLAVCFGRSW